MKALSLLLLFNFAYRIYADCPNGTFPNASGGKCYFIPNDSENFILAEMNCQEQNGDLASISNAFDNNALTANATNLLGSNVTYAWLGGRKDRKGTWIWSDGQNFTYTHWANGNPDNNNDDNCMVLNLSNGQWYSHNCYDILPYICDFSQTNCPTCTPCPQTTCPPCQSHCEFSCPDNWVYNSKTGFCYKVFFNDTYISYNNSESVCNQYNGHLVSIHSSDENFFLSSLKYISPFIGLHYDSKNNTFQWSDNTPVNYTNFYSNDTSTGLNCFIQSYANGLWYTQNCSYTRGSYNRGGGFVCKARPQNNTLEYKIRDSVFLNIIEGNTKPINSYFEQDQCSNTCPTCVPDSCTPCPCNMKCPDGWTHYSATNFCYKLYHYPNYHFNFSNVEQTCQQSNSHLISIHNETENNFLQQLVSTYDGFWIGLSYNVSLSNFTWTDNTPYDYSNWKSGQPNTTSNHHCVINWGFASVPSFTWNTYPCNSTASFVCKKPPNF